jgi:hypothetical protein
MATAIISIYQDAASTASFRVNSLGAILFRSSSFVKWILSAVALVACSSGAPTISSTAVAPLPTTFQPAVTIFAPVSTATQLPPQATATPQPSATPKPLNVALAADVNPFTGIVMSDTTKLDRRPILIKVANTSEVRPQSGLSYADVVFEHYVEGGITRFAALYLTNDVNKIGSVRSCRLIDLELPAIFDAGLICSGTSPGVKPLMRDSFAFKNELSMISDFGPYECPTCPMYRTNEADPPHNLFANTVNARKELTDRSKNQRSEFKGWTFDSAAPSSTLLAQQIIVPYKSGAVGWTFDAAMNKYSRTLAGAPFTDKLTGKALTADNVIVVFAYHADTDIVEDVTGAKSIQIQWWGQGPLKIARDGKLISGLWKRLTPTGSMNFFDDAGNPIALKPGNSFVQFVPLEFAVEVK